MSPLQVVAEDVWLLRGGVPRTMNVYFIRTSGGIIIFDAGVKSMTKQILAAAAELGQIERVVLSHAHADHRGAAPGLGAPVFCHSADRRDAEGDGGLHYFEFSKLPVPGRFVMPLLLKMWDGGPVKIAGTVEEGEAVAGFEVVHVPGHAPGMIALWRASDRLALTGDVFYTLNPLTGLKGSPRLPLDALNLSTDEARLSLEKVANLEPASAWPGHADPLRGDVRSQLLRVAEA